MCQQFVTTDLNKTLSAEGVWDILDYDYYPWGNAYYNTSKCGTPSYDKPNGMYCWVRECGVENPPEDCFKGSIMCQHGQNECDDNRLEACARYLFKKTMGFEVALFSYCIENYRFGSAALCGTFSGLDGSQIADCFNSAVGDAATQEVALATAQYGDSRLGTPWVVLNGKQVEDTGTLLHQVCEAYTGEKPAGCPRSKIVRRINDFEIM